MDEGFNELADEGWGDEEDADGDGDDQKRRQVTAMTATNSNLYYSQNEFLLKRFNYRRKNCELIAKRKNAGNLLKIRVNNNESNLIALSTNCQILHIELGRSKTPPTTPNTTPKASETLSVGFTKRMC